MQLGCTDVDGHALAMLVRKLPVTHPRYLVTLSVQLKSRQLQCILQYFGGEVITVQAGSALLGGAWAVVDVTVSHGWLVLRVNGASSSPARRLWDEAEAPPAPAILERPSFHLHGPAFWKVAAPVVVADAWVQSRIGAGCGPPDIRAPAAELGAALVSEVVAGMHAVPRALALLCDGVAVSPALCTRAERDGLVRAILDLACDDRRPPVMRIGALRTARVLTVDTPMDAARPEVPRANASELVTRLWSLAAAPAVARMLSCVAFNDTTPRGCAVVGGIAAEAAAFLQALLAGSACYGDAARDKLRRGLHELPLAAVWGTEVGAGHVRAGARIAVYVARSRT